MKGVYTYKVIDTNQLKQGYIFAENKEEVRNILKENSVEILKITYNPFLQKKLSDTELIYLCLSIKIFYSNGDTILSALQSVKRSTQNRFFQGVVERLIIELQKGRMLSFSFQTLSTVFDKIFVKLITLGERGNLIQALDHLMVYLHDRNRYASKIRQILIYPCILIFSLFLNMSIFVYYFIPKIEEIFNQQMFVYLKYFYYSLLGVLIVGGGLLFYKKTRFKTMSLLPFIKNLFLFGELARFNYAFGVLLQNNLIIEEAFLLSLDCVYDINIKKEIYNLYKNTQNHKNINSKHLPHFFYTTFALGIRNKNFSTFYELADYFLAKSEGLKNQLITLISPVAVFITGSITLCFMWSLSNEISSLLL